LDFELGPAGDDFLAGPEFQTGKVRVQVQVSEGSGMEGLKPEFIAAACRGFESMWHVGPMAGLEMHSYKVRLEGGAANYNSNPLAFELCAREAFRAVGLQCQPILVEPVMSVEVICPDEFMGGIMGDLNRRRGAPQGVQSRITHTVIKAHVPLAELFGYANTVRNLSSGRAVASITFSHYAPVPENISKNILEHRKGYWQT